MTTTLRAWFADFTERTGEVPTHIVFGEIDGVLDPPPWEELPTIGVVVPWSEVASAILDVEFDDGYGGNNSPNLCAWSPSWVIFACDYDGSEWLSWVPRRPKAHSPVRPGGG